MPETPNPVSPKVAAPAVAGVIVGTVILVAAFFGHDIKVGQEDVSQWTTAVAYALTALQFIIGFLRRDPLRK